jgi:hypothetical protein
MPARAQAPDSETRTDILEKEQLEKVSQLHPYVPGLAEKYVDYAENILTEGLRWHPFFTSAYAGGGFTLGAGHRSYVSSYNTLDLRGSITFRNYKRLEAEFIAPRLFKRQGTLSLLGGWREATEVGYYGLGISTSEGSRANYGFKQPYGAALLTVHPGRGPFFVRGGLEASRWNLGEGSGSAPSVEEIYTPDALPGLGATVTYLHSQAAAGIDTREAPGYARSGGYLAATFHDFNDVDNRYGFTQWDYEGLYHVPLVRAAWVLSFRGAVTTTALKSGEQIPFFMMPSLGSGETLRGYASWRFRDRNTMLLQGEWRIIANRFLDMAVFYDTGKVTANSRDLDLHGLKDDVGVGFRFHGPTATPLRIDFAKGSEGLNIVFSASAAF